MTHMRNIDSIPDPKKKSSDKDVVDPKRFQKALKVEKGDEIDKREKRNRPRKQEELEDEVDDVGATVHVPEGLFKEFMKEEEKGPSALDAEGGTQVTLTPEGGDTPESTKGANYIPDAGDKQSNIKIGVSEDISSEASTLESDEVPDIEEPAPQDQSQLTDQDQSSTFQEPQTPPPSEDNFKIDDPTKMDDTKPQEVDKSKEPEKTKEKEKKKKIEKTSKKKTEKKDQKEKAVKLEKGKESKEVKEPKKSDTQALKEPIKSKETIKGKTSQEIHKEAPKEKMDQSTTAPLEGLKDKQDSKDKDSDTSKENVSAPAPVAPLATAEHVEALQQSPFANMPKDVFELFEKMVGMMTMQQDQGKNTITLQLNMKGSVFDKCELVIMHYDTAPHAYNVQFVGNPEGVERFAKNMQGLNNAITESKLNFTIHLLPPRLQKNYSRRIESTDTDMDNQEKNDGEESQN